MIGIIAAVSINGVIGVDNKLPFHYPEDLKRFKRMTTDSVVIMGRSTFESIGKPLPNRENVVISSQNLEIPGVRRYGSVASAIAHESLLLRDHAVNTWFIGGASIYQEAMLYADQIFLTLTPDYISDNNSVKFPFINPILYKLYDTYELGDTKLMCAVYHRIIESDETNESWEKIISEIKILKNS